MTGTAASADPTPPPGTGGVVDTPSTAPARVSAAEGGPAGTTHVTAGAAPGLLIGGTDSAPGRGPEGLVYDNTGRVLYRAGDTTGTTVVAFKGSPVLADRSPYGGWRLTNTHGEQVGRVPAPYLNTADHLSTDTQGTKALITGSAWATVDLSATGGAKDAKVLAGVVREVELSSGKTLFEWNSLGSETARVPVQDSLTPAAADYLGVNAASYAPDGTILVSGGGTGSVYKLAQATGTFDWILGGKRDQFGLAGTSAAPAHPIDARMDENGALSFLDAGNGGSGARSVTYAVDGNAKKAQRTWNWAPATPVTGLLTGGNQVLPNGNRLLTFGEQGKVVEVAADGDVVFENQAAAGVHVSRTERVTWKTAPTEEPYLGYDGLARLDSKTATMRLRWNGQTELVSWQVRSGQDKDHLDKVFTLPAVDTAVNLEIPLAPSDAAFTVTGLDKDGASLPVGTTPVTYLDVLSGGVARLADPASMGVATSFPYRIGEGWVRDYTQGLAYTTGGTAPTGEVSAIAGAVATEYRKYGGPDGFLGPPVATMRVHPDGGRSVKLRNFAYIAWSPATGAHLIASVMSQSWDTYWNSHMGLPGVISGDPTTFIGYPKGEQQSDPYGTGCYQEFTKATMYAKGCSLVNGNRAFPVFEPVLGKWNSMKEEGRRVLGYPNFAPYQGGMDFERGIITYSDETGAHAVFGGILAVAWKGDNVFIGAPTTDELPAGDGIGRVQHFQHASIYWSPSSGAGTVHGGIRDKWLALGGVRSFLGYPTSGEVYVGFDPIATFNQFQRGVVFWTAGTGAHEVHGGIWALWSHTPAEQAYYGYPTTDEMPTPDGRGAYQLFERSGMYWTPQTGAHEVHGGIRDAWVAAGAERGRLGYPTSNEYSPADGLRRSDFEHGYIEWSAATGQTRTVVR
ncbi:arylsulfotransferase family protein [Yinghuangia seranimata]|uniref:arylsulfotransferase family protein n=1 Tax=Yinghuangia seranimata TaxID=408067 RepID=UPI00248C3128|nr:arylsulfotransferase family protein [Yinghuangia seranimata]MDI2131754.1 arylsulfotransferase family protein [Yinghuangia seranimata]